MNANELNNLRQLWASHDHANQNLACELTFSQNLQHLLLPELLIAELYGKRKKIKSKIHAYFCQLVKDYPKSSDDSLDFEADFVPYSKSTFGLFTGLYSPVKRGVAIHQVIDKALALFENINLVFDKVAVANALMRHTGLGVFFVLEYDLSEQVDYDLFVTVLRNRMYYHSRIMDYDLSIITPNYFANFNLMLPKCAATIFPRALCELKELEHLDISGLKKVEHIPAEFGQLSNLKTLKINHFVTLPVEMAQCQKIESVELNDCRFVYEKILTPQFADLSVFPNAKHWILNNIHSLDLEKLLPTIPQALSLRFIDCEIERFSMSNRMRQIICDLSIGHGEMTFLPDNTNFIEL